MIVEDQLQLALVKLQNLDSPDTKPVLYQDRFCIFYRGYLTGFVPQRVDTKPAKYQILSLLLQNRLCAYVKPAAPKPALYRPQTCRNKTGFVPSLNMLQQNWLFVSRC